MRAWLISIFAIFSLTAQAQEFKIAFDKDTMLIGDHLTLSLEVSSMQAGQAVHFPELLDSAMTFDIIETFPLDTIEAGLRLEVLMTQFEAGMYEVSTVPVLIEQKDGTLDTLLSNTIQLMVNTLEVDTTQAIKPIKTVKSLPFPWKAFFKKLALWLIPILIIILLVVWYVLRKKDIKLFKEKPKTMLDYYHEAINKLQALENEKLWQNDQVKEYYLGLSEILREYLEGRFGIQAMESTTDEINENLIIQDSLKMKLKEVLGQADLAKFAKFKPLGDENIRMMKLAKDFVRHTKPKSLTEEKDA